MLYSYLIHPYNINSGNFSIHSLVKHRKASGFIIKYLCVCSRTGCDGEIVAVLYFLDSCMCILFGFDFVDYTVT